MFRLGLLSLFFTAALFGGLLDFRTLSQAKEAYANGKYAEAAALYESIKEKNDDLHFNLGDAYYKEQKYDAALKEYEQVQKPDLRAKALHNMGNAYANTQKIDEAVRSYEEALKLSEDEDTKYNLELLKKQKEQQQKQDKEDQKKQDDRKKEQKEQENKNDQQDQQQDQNSDQKSEEDQQKSQNEQQEEEAKKEEQEKEAKEDEESKDDKSEKEQNVMSQNEAREEPISDMQERKYEKMLEKRGIRTLMVPLKTEGARDEETTAW